MAFDQAPSNGSERERLARLITQKLEHGSDQEASGLLRQLTGSPGQQRRGDQLKRGDLPDAAKMKRAGEDDEDDELRARLAARLRAQGKSEDEIKTVCDIALGPERSAMRGGSFGSGQGGALHSERDQPSLQPLSSPAARDLAGLCAEEQMGIEPIKDRGRGIGRDDFGMLYGMVPTFERLQPRRKPTASQIAMDEAAVKGFYDRFPTAARIKPAV
jgi:hypothetical protein